MVAILTAVAAFVLGVALTHLFIRMADRQGVLAHANERSMHRGATVTGGGLPLLVAALAAFFIFWPTQNIHGLILPAAALLALVSFFDDLKPVAQWVRFGAHIVAAAAAISVVQSDQMIFQDWLPYWLDRGLALFLVVWFINLFNFMDGIDGIAGIETIFIMAGFLIVSTVAGAETPLDGLAFAFAGATAGFLFWNWHPARVFMGDVGSIPLGFLCAAMLIWLAVNVSLAAALILPLYFVADATITILTRLSRGEKIWQAHRSHFYQRSARGVSSHAIVVRRVAACNGVLIALAVLALSMPATAFCLAVLSVAILLVWMQVAADANVAIEAGAS